MSFWEIVGLILAAAATMAVVLGIFLWINAWQIRREREHFIREQTEKSKK